MSKFSSTDSGATILSKLNNTIVTVGMETGADYVCDGTADDVQIQAAIDFVNAAGGGTVFLRNATYNTTSSIYLKSGVSLIGESVGTTIIKGANTDFIIIKTTQDGTTKNIYSNITVRSLSILSQYGHCAAIMNVDGLTIQNTEWYFSAFTAIRESMFIQHCQNINVTNNYLHDLAGDGVQINACDNFVVSNNLIDGNSLYTHTDDAIDIDCDFLDTDIIPSRYGSVTGNTIKNVRAGNGIRVENSEDVSVAGNTLYNCGTESGSAGAITVNATTGLEVSNVTVSGNTIDNCPTTGISVIDDGTVTNVSVYGNTIVNCGANAGSNIRGGIILNATNVSCGNNTVDSTLKSGANGAGIIVYKKDGQHIFGNYVKNCITGIRTWNGDSLQSYTKLNISGNIFDGNTTNMVFSGVTPSTDVIIRNNVGWVTENSGTGTIASGATTAVVTHGLSVTPTLDDISITFGEQGSNDYGRWWISNLTSTQFTLNVSADPGASGLDFSWKAIVL